MQRQLLANPGGRFSVQKQYDTLRSQGVRVGKDTLHAYLGYLEDAFLVRTVSLHSPSERRRMVHARKAYPVDPGLIELFATSGRSHDGRALETAVLLELERRGWEVSYVRTTEGWEVDFLRVPRGGVGPNWCRCPWRRPRTRPGNGRCERSGRPVRRTRMPVSCSSRSTRHRRVDRCRSASPGSRLRAGSWIVDSVPEPAVLWREVK